MGKAELLKLLEQVEQQIAHDMELIARQRKVLAELDRKEVDNDALQIMLVGLENLLVAHLQEREKLRAMLAELEGSTQGPERPDR
jgi:hypothetical protein